MRSRDVPAERRLREWEGQSASAARQMLEPLRQRRKRHGHGECRQRQGDGRQTQGGKPEQVADHTGDETGDGDREEWAHPVLGNDVRGIVAGELESLLPEDEDRRRVAPDRHECGMAERDLAVVPREDVETEQRDEVDPDERELAEAELARELRQHHDQQDRAHHLPEPEEADCIPGRVTDDGSRVALQEHGQSGRQSELLADEVDVAAEQVDHDAESEAADDCADRTVDSAEYRRGERVDQDDEHHVGVEEDRRRGHHPRDRAEGSREAPAQRKHPADTNSHQPARIGIEGDRPHREPERREPEEEPEHGDGA